MIWGFLPISGNISRALTLFGFLILTKLFEVNRLSYQANLIGKGYKSVKMQRAGSMWYINTFTKESQYALSLRT
jgi:hypothetical protein